jgi:hypothetical protein
MDTATITYNRLFTLLLSLGFEEESPASAVEKDPRVFVHEPTETVLMFRNATGEVVSPADVLSTEVHLQARNLVNQSLESLVRTQSVQ